MFLQKHDVPCPLNLFWRFPYLLQLIAEIRKQPHGAYDWRLPVLYLPQSKR